MQQSSSNEIINAAVPAAQPVEKGRFVLDLHNRDEDSIADESVTSANTNSIAAPDSPKSFNSDEIFEDVDVEYGEEGKISDHDLDRLLGPLPSRRTTNPPQNSLETDCNDDDSHDSSTRRKRLNKGSCPCCPRAVQRGPWQFLATASVPQSTRVGNMIVLHKKCFHTMGFGIVGPHWFGPICCLGLLTGATAYFCPKAYNNIGILSGVMCLLFYIVGTVSLVIVSCSDPGVVKSDGMRRNGYNGVPTADVSAGRGWRYCDICSVYQPPDAVHCPDCNVCVEGYDHHCPWMGTCIGKKNFTSFMAFNLTWLFYLMYAIIWVTFIGNSFYVPGKEIESSSGDV